MTRFSSMPTRAVTTALLGGCLLGIPSIGWPQEQAETAPPSAPRAMSAQQAFEAMAGMGGIFRMTPNGDTYLYPLVKLEQNIYGMHGSYRVTPQGILLIPTGMEAPDLSMELMGGVSGSFRLTPDGSAYFQPTPHAPVGMSGETGRGNP